MIDIRVLLTMSGVTTEGNISSLEEWEKIDTAVRALFELGDMVKERTGDRIRVYAETEYHTKKRELVDYIYDAMEQAELGLKVSAICARVQNAGYNFGTALNQTRKSNVTRAMARRSDLFTKIGHGRWILAKYYHAPLPSEELAPFHDMPVPVR